MIEVDKLVKIFVTGKDSHRAVDSSSLAVRDGEICCLLGPSGGGKTTMLRSIAGLETPESGEIQINNRLVFSDVQRVNVPVHQRHLGFVFQNYAIWPHMTVYQNVEFPLAVARPRVPEADRKERVHKVLELVGLDGFASRDGTLLSGGQQQRLALARAIVGEPEVLLLDEPLSNLDAKLRDEVRLELHQLQRRLGITTVFVTHDQTEAIALADTVAVMLTGKVRQIGTPEEVYERPVDVEVARFFGFANIFAGEWKAADRFSIGPIELKITAGRDNRESPTGTAKQYLVVRPEHITVRAGGAPAIEGDCDIISGVVLTNVYKGSVSEVRVEVAPGIVLQVRADDGTWLHEGARVDLSIPHGVCRVLSEVAGVTEDTSAAKVDASVSS